MKTQHRVERVNRRLVIGVVASIFVLLFVFCGYRYASAPLATSPNVQYVTVQPVKKLSLMWPSYGQSAVATKDYGVLATHGSSKPQPTASTAKLITMLAVMQKKPFSDKKGDNITFTQQDVDRYNVYVAGNGSVVPVSNGLTWTQYQAMEATLLESANNVADSLAIWTFGSLDKYREYAQNMVKKLGMNDTTIGQDASGYHATTTSTAHDLALLARAALDEPMIRSIVSTKSVTLPGAGEIHNTSNYLGENGVEGMKTGFTPEAGGVYVLAGEQKSGEHSQDIITVVMGAPSSTSAIAQDSAYELYLSARKNFVYQEIVKKGQTIATYQPKWNKETYALKAERSVGAFVWSGKTPTVKVVAANNENGDDSTGSVKLQFGDWSVDANAKLQSDIPRASAWWRVIH